VVHFIAREEHPLPKHRTLVISGRAYRAIGISGKLQGRLPLFCSLQEDFKEVLLSWIAIK
jgi:hypothetical protein